MIHLKNKYQAIKAEYLENIAQYTEGHYNKICKQVINEIVDAAINKELDIYLEAYLDEALETIFDLRVALNDADSVWNKNEKIEGFYQNNTDYEIEPWKSYDNSICISSVNEAISKYILYDWCSPTLEWFMINGYLTYVIHQNRERYIHQCGNVKSIASLFSNERSYKISYFLLKILECWIFLIKLPSFILENFLNDNFVIGFGIIALLAMYAGYYYRKMKYKKKWRHLLDLKLYASSKLFSPSILLKKAKNVSKFFFMPELTPIARIVRRDADIFNIVRRKNV